MSAPGIISDLVRRFEDNLESYKKDHYNETHVRVDYINPFFEALGWDVINKKGWAENYREVIHEDSIKVGGATKAPDYCFRVGNKRLFFLEAKKPAVNIQSGLDPAFQLRRYGWSAKLPLSILTDFEEFSVYDCRFEPKKTDKASHSRILYLKYTDYIDKWGDIAAVFSRDAVLKGAFDKFAASNKQKKGTMDVDTAFLLEIERWRESLARNIALRNPTLSQRDLNFAVQQTIDRIVFLRICEDRGIETYGRLMALRNGNNVYARLFALFREADDKYNSGLFHFKKEKGREYFDGLTPNLTVDDKVLKDVFKNLYYPDSPYEFSVLPADILGQIYERFLGKVIRLTAGHQAKIEEKPEVRKAGGVYYTPTYIVEYIVQNTVGKLVAGKKPGPRGGVAHLKILDPACGSGSFLIGAYQFLLDWHRDQYVKDDPEKWAKGKKPTLYQTMKGDWRLTTDERKRILMNNIYGVDIDPQAVEVTKLSLLLKVLEGEDEQSIGRQMSLFRERVLPDLSNNIKCGNSLIGSDFYSGRQMALSDEEEMFRVNAFDWDVEFAESMSSGGFDAVIGNPPYVRQELLGDVKPYLQGHYATYQGTADLYVYFIEKSLSLMRPDGLFSFIVANKWMRANYGKPLRQWMKGRHIVEIADFGDLPVFQQATTYPCIVVIKKASPATTFRASQIKRLDFLSLCDHIERIGYEVNQASLDENGWSLVDLKTQDLLNKLFKTGVPLGEYAKNICYGIKTGFNEAFVIDDSIRKKLINEDPKSEEVIKPFLAGKDIKRYRRPINNKYLIFTKRGIDFEGYTAIKKYLMRFKEKLVPRPKDWKGKWAGRKPGTYQWYEIQDTVAYHAEFEKTKIIIPAIVKKASYAYDTEGFYSNDKTSIIPVDDLYLLGLLNSKTLDFVLHAIASTKQGGYFEYKPMYIQKLPIRTIDMSNPAEKERHEQIVALVSQILDLNQKRDAAGTPQSKDMLHRQIQATDAQIDRLVYQLYDLTEDEIKIIESEN